MQENYKLLISKLQNTTYSESGKQYIIDYVDEIIREQNNCITKNNIENSIKNNFPLTTGYSFEGYNITKYYGLSSGSTVLGTGILSEYKAARSDWFGMESDIFSDKLEEARQSALTKMIQFAMDKGGNALIGISFNYVCFSSNMIGVIANGTVVNIEEKTQNTET